MSKPDSTTDAEPRVNRKYLVALGILVLFLAGYLAISFSGGPPSPSALASRCLSASDAGERKRAAEGLTSVVDRVAALPQLRRVAKETKDPEVLALVLSRLLVLRDNENLALCFDGLKNPSKDVRVKVYGAVQAFYGGSLPDGIECSADASAEEYATVVAKLNEFYAKAQKMMPAGMPGASRSGTETAAATPTPTPSPSPTPASTPSPTPMPGPSPAPSPAPAPATAAPAHAPPTAVVVASYENPAINLLAWMFRVLAAFIVFGEIVGAISLIISERPRKGAAIKDKPPSLAEELEAVLARNSAGLWLKITVLVAGAICAAALLMAAEMSQMAVQMNQLAVRVEQRLENLPPNR